MAGLAGEAWSRGALVRAPRPALDRLAKFLKLRSEPSWSNRHVASLIWWRVTRTGWNRH